MKTKFKILHFCSILEAFDGWTVGNDLAGVGCRDRPVSVEDETLVWVEGLRISEGARLTARG